MPTPVATLRASLSRHNDAFESLLRLIPAKYYLVQDNDEQIASKFQKNSKKKKAPKQAIKEASKKARKEKLDPTNNKSVIDIQNESLRQKPGKRKSSEAFSDDDDNNGDDDGIQMQVDVDLEAGDDMEETTLTPMPQPESVEVLRKKLHSRMAELRNKGRRPSKVGEAEDRDELLEERRKQRAALRERRKKEKKEKIKGVAEVTGKKGKDSREEKLRGNATKIQLLVPDHSSKLSTQPTGPQSKLTTVSFGNVVSQNPKKADKFKTTSDPQQALEQLAARKKKMASLSEDKQKVIEEKDKWAKAEARLDGTKIHDDEAKLKKAAKRKEKVKEKSKKTWAERKEQVAASMAAKQKKRADNIASRNERRQDKRKGKARPGFEGKSFGKGSKKPRAKK